MDPLSASTAGAAGVAGLLSLALQTTEYLWKFYSAYKDRDSDLRNIANKIEDLLLSLRNIDEVVRIRKWRSDEEQIRKNIGISISRCEPIIRELQDEAAKFRKTPNDTILNTLKVKGRRAAYPIRRSTLEKLDEDVEAFRDNLSTALEALNLKEHRNTQDDLQDIKLVIQNCHIQQVSSAIRTWLKPPDAFVDYNAAYEKRHPETGSWFVQGSDFKSWLVKESSFLWLYGFAGCGKSVLCSTAIQHTFQHCQRQSAAAVAFFFFTFNDQSKQGTADLLRALLVQLASQISDLKDDLTQLKDAHNDGIPPTSVLLECLQKAISKHRSYQIYILLDALDECSEDGSRATVLEAVETIRSWSYLNLHLLVTSRDLLDIRQSLDAQTVESVELKNENINNDIRNYVSSKMRHDRQLRLWNDDDRRLIENTLSEKAAGVFRWVECQLIPLRRCPRSQYHLKKCLETLPVGLDKTYERMLLAIGDELKEEAKRILTFLCFTLEPLSVEEMIHALAVDVDDTECYDEERKLTSGDDLLQICPGLIEIYHKNATGLREEVHGRESNEEGTDSNVNGSVQGDDALDNTEGGLDDDASNEDDPDIVESDESLLDIEGDGDESESVEQYFIRIAHYSVQEYLKSTLIEKGSASFFSMKNFEGHLLLSKTCLLYLCTNSSVDPCWEKEGKQLAENQVITSGLTRYARDCWHEHYMHLENCAEEPLAKWVHRTLTTPYIWKFWTRDGYPETAVEKYDDSDKAFAAGYCAAYLNLCNTLQSFILREQVNLNARGGVYGSALQAASAHGSEASLQILIKAGLNVNNRREGEASALYLASKGHHENIVRILLDAGADVNAQGGAYGTALGAALDTYMGGEQVIRILLDAGANVNAQTGQFGNALGIAARWGHERPLRILLEAGADIEVAVNDDYGSILAAAAYSGRVKVVQILLEAGANVNARVGGRYGNALVAAAGGLLGAKSENVVQILLDAGADVNAQVSGEYGTALVAAVCWGNDEIIDILLDAGADVNVVAGCTYGTALGAAIACGVHSAIRPLLEAGADINVQGGKYGSVLGITARSEQDRLVEIFLDMGADVNTSGGDYGSVLAIAAHWAKEETVQTLLNANAYVNAKGGMFGDALQALAASKEGSSSRRLNILHLLLDAGADVNATGGKFGSALQAAQRTGNDDIAEVLIQYGAKTNEGHQILTMRQNENYNGVAEEKNSDGRNESEWEV